MSSSVFLEMRFWLLVALSIVAPAVIYAVLLGRVTISRRAVLLFGLCLVLMSGLDVYLLQSLAVAAKHSSSTADDSVFASEVSFALYLLPALLAGVGINMVSHVLIQHLELAEKRYERQQRSGHKPP